MTNRNQDVEEPRAAATRPDNLPNPTANTSLTDPGPPPAQGTPMSARRENPPVGSGNMPQDPDLIPWDPTGKIDDEVERRYRPAPGTPKGGGTPPAGETGPGRYGGATDQAPTDMYEGATTTLAARAADGSEHEMRQTAALGAHDQRPAETGPGGSANQQTMQGSQDFADESPARPHRVEQYGGGGGYSEVY